MVRWRKCPRGIVPSKSGGGNVCLGNCPRGIRPKGKCLLKEMSEIHSMDSSWFDKVAVLSEASAVMTVSQCMVKKTEQLANNTCPINGSTIASVYISGLCVCGSGCLLLEVLNLVHCNALLFDQIIGVSHANIPLAF